MSDANRHMDEQFRKMSEELQANYHQDYWKEASKLMENDSLDQAFKDAASVYTAAEVGGIELASGSLGDAFMDDAFREASKQVTIPYESAFWNELEANRADIEMNTAFHQASGAVKAQYSPTFWGDANAALQKEGLHYEYKSAYWNEARDLLDKLDRRSFFFRWSGVAVLLLLISFVGLNEIRDDNFVQDSRQRNLNKTTFGENRGNDNQVARTEDIGIENNSTELYNPNNYLNTADQNSNVNINTQFENANNSSPISNNDRTELTDAEADSDARVENGDPTNQFVEGPAINEGSEEKIENIKEEDLSLEIVEGINFGNHHDNKAKSESFDFAPLYINPLPSSVSKIEQKLSRNVPLGPPTIEKGLKMTRHNFALIGGIGIGNSYGFETMTTTPRYSAGLEYTVNGSGALRQFEFGVNTMLNYSTHENVRKEIKVDSFLVDGSSKNYWVSLRVFDLFYVNTNAFVNYRIGLKHKLRFGLGVERLAMVQSNMSYKIGDDTGLETVNNNWGVKRGIAQWDMRCSLGYEYRLNKKLSMNITGAFGLADRTANDFYSLEPINDREMNIMFGVKYNLLTRIR